MRILVTGANGFIGRHLSQALSARGHEWRAAVRRADRSIGPQRIAVGDIGPDTDWRAALAGIEVVVHLAGRAHILKETAADPARAFLRVNAAGTAQLVASARAAGVRRLIYVSSIGVLGNTSGAAGFDAHSPPHPHNAYARSKLEGERLAAEAAQQTVELAIVRPPLVYGAGVRANFLRIMSWVDRGWPLPFGAVHNQRSLVSAWNLADLLARLCEAPLPQHSLWLVSDGENVSTAELVRRLAELLGRRARLLAVPPGVLRTLGALSGRGPEIEALCGSLVVDSRATRIALGWSPPLSLDAGLERTVQAYRAQLTHGH